MWRLGFGVYMIFLPSKIVRAIMADNHISNVLYDVEFFVCERSAVKAAYIV